MTQNELLLLARGDPGLYDGQFHCDVKSSQLETIFAKNTAKALSTGKLSGIGDRQGVALYNDLAWDTQHFGLPMSRLLYLLGHDYDTRRLRLAEFLDDAQHRGIRHISCRSNDADQELVQLLIEAGFERMGAKAMLSAAPLSTPTNASFGKNITIKPMHSDDHNTLAVMVADSIRINRFAVDSLLDPGKAHQVYMSWFSNIANTDSKLIFVAHINTEVAGVVACTMGIPLYGVMSELGLRPGFVGLFAVNAHYRGRKLGQLLLGHARHELSNHGCNKIYANTDVTNQASLASFERAGFTNFSGFTEWRWGQS